MQVSTNLSSQLQDYLNLSSAELKITAENMANIDTPGYKTQGFDFKGAVQNILTRSDREFGRSQFETTAPHTDDVDHLIARPDGNNVSMDREGLKMAEAQLKFRAGVELLKREYGRVLDAIHADAK
jgi:flagellar basal-body rod protein FlgB